MMRWAGAGVAVAMVLAVAGATAWAQEAEGERFRAGAYAMNVTPPESMRPISISGSMRDRSVSDVTDPLHARCLVLDDGEGSIAFVVVDSCMLPRELMDEAKQLAERRTGIAADRIMISATHTHSAPTTGGVFQSDPVPEYVAFLIEKIASGIERAQAQLEPAQVAWAIAEGPDQVFNRRWKLRPDRLATDPFGRQRDRVRMNPGYSNPDVTSNGPADRDLAMLAVRSPDGRPIAVLANYALHYVGGVSGISADYFGAFARKIARNLEAEQADPAFVGIMSNGASGDINNNDYSLSERPARERGEQIDIVAGEVAEVATQMYRNLDWQDHASLQIAEAEIELGVRKGDADELARARRILDEAAAEGKDVLTTREEIYARETVLLDDYDDTVELKLQGIRVGELNIATIPCEVFVEIGMEIKDFRDPEPTMVISLANGYNGYLPTAEAHELGGYETWRARSSYLEEQAAPKIISALKDLMPE